MIFLNEHSPSIPAKVLMSMGVLAGGLTATALTTSYSDWLMSVLNFEEVEGNIYRQIIMFTCCFVYFLRFSMGLFVFMQRKISWFEGGLVTVLFFLMFYTFGISAGSYPEPIGPIDMAGIAMFLIGSYINILADYQRFSWKREIKNKGRLYTSGLFKYSMHINYFGDAVAYLGLALITYHIVCLCISIFCFPGNTLGRRQDGRAWGQTISCRHTELDRCTAAKCVYPIAIQKKNAGDCQFLYVLRPQRKPQPISLE